VSRPSEALPDTQDDEEARLRLSLFAPSPDDTPSLRGIKIAVIAMGIILIVGLAIVIARIVYLMTRPSASPPAASSATISLPADTEIRTMAISGDRLAVHVVDGTGQRSILIIDLLSGRTLSRLGLSPEVPSGSGHPKR